jgi:hypothetical protein
VTCPETPGWLEAGTLSRIGDGGSGELYSVLEQMPPEIRTVLSKFPKVINASKRLPEVKHTVVHIIETTGRPVAAKFQQLDPVKLAAAKADFLQIGESQLLCEFSTGRARPLVPAVFRQEVFQAMQNLAHPGIHATKRLISARFVWPAMCRDCVQMWWHTAETACGVHVVSQKGSVLHRRNPYRYQKDSLCTCTWT